MGTNAGTRRVVAALALCVGLALCATPYARRLRNPSLYADDVDRVAQLQTEPFAALLFAPFNEHLAPLFQLVSWTTWRLSGRSLTAARGGFTIASALPFVLTLGLLWRVVRRETGSAGASLTTLAVFSISWLAIETVYWYSASSFMWSLLLTLAAWDAAGSRRRGLGLLAAAAAPAFSMIGVLAGPVAAVRVLGTRGKQSGTGTLAPIAGTALFLLLYVAVHDRTRDPAAPAARLWPGLVAATRAPSAALVPAVVGVRTLPTAGFAGILSTAATLCAVAALLVHAWRRPEARSATLGGLVLIAGGYVLTFCPRAGGPGRLLETQRYHLFPMLGLVFVSLPWLKRGFARWADRPEVGLSIGAAVAALLLMTHHAEMKGRARFLRFPDQPAILAALDRLGATRNRAGVTRPQALAALPPTFAPWAPANRSVLVMLGPCAPVARMPDSHVKILLLDDIRPVDRIALRSSETLLHQNRERGQRSRTNE